MFQPHPIRQNGELSDLNIEIAHISWFGENDDLSAKESLMIAEEWISNQRTPRSKIAFSMLVDEGDHVIPSRGEWLLKAHKKYPDVFSIVDHICFESDLRSLTPRFVSLLMESNRNRRAREFQRYEDKHGLVACSHDVAIWHALRLGLLGTSDLPIDIWSTSKTPGETPSFFARTVTSVLEESDRGAELRAGEILEELHDGSIPSLIKTLFYAV